MPSSPPLISENQVIDHYENPRNVGSMDKKDMNVGTGLVGAPACGDVMKLQVGFLFFFKQNILHHPPSSQTTAACPKKFVPLQALFAWCCSLPIVY